MDTNTEDTGQPSTTVGQETTAKLDLDPSDAEKTTLPRRRLATIYDAVAGKVAKTKRLDQKEPSGQEQYRVTRHPTRGAPIAPDEVLFRRKDAPERYAEQDVYNSHERELPRGGQGVLPDSDLLKSVHAYSSRFYGAMERRGGSGNGSTGRHSVDERSMDESALLAFGILLEEAGREVLGRRGDLVFTEPGSSSGDEVAPSTESAVGYRGVGSTLKPRTNTSVAAGRLPKRRRLAEEEAE